ncbi:MAG TPA: CAP domain-containing protein [Alphaproteobacteria bacterium]
MNIAKPSILFAFVICLVAAPAMAAGPAADPAAAANLLALVNQARSNAGLAPVHANPELGAAAQSLAEDLARRGVLSHEDSKGAGIDVRFLQSGYRYSIAAEVVAAPFTKPEDVIADWMANPSNREQILTEDLQDAGVGYAIGPIGSLPGQANGFWVLDMGSPIVVHY